MVRKLTVLVVLLLVAAGCGGKQAATAEDQAWLNAGQDLKTLSADYVKTNAKYVAQCKPPRVLDAQTCDAWVRYTAEFVREWDLADMDLRANNTASAVGKTNVLKTNLAVYTSRTK